MAILLLVVIAIGLAIIFVGFKGKKMNVLHKSEAARISASIPA